MPAGKLRTSLVLEKRAQAPDDTDGIVSTFDVIGKVWADLRQVKAGTYVDGQQVGEGVTHTARIRPRRRTDFNFFSIGSNRYRVIRLGDTLGTGRWIDVYAEELRPGEDA